MKDQSDFTSELERLAFEPEEIWLEKLYKFTGFEPVTSGLSITSIQKPILRLVPNDTSEIEPNLSSKKT